MNELGRQMDAINADRTTPRWAVTVKLKPKR